MMFPLLIFFSIFISGISFSADFPIPSPPQIGASSFIVIDAYSSEVIAQSNSDERVEPASITKLMTAYVVFNALRNGQISLEDEVLISEKAWRTEGSRMFIEVDTYVSVLDLLKGMIIQSGNDASVALAEYVAGSEEMFVNLMNHYASILEMDNSYFSNSTGLPAENQYVSTKDVAILSQALIKNFPEYYSWYSEKEFTFNNIRQYNRNLLLWRDDTVDGLKTGYTENAGYCLVSSAERSDMRLISVVMGMDNTDSRAEASLSLLNFGFRFFETHKLYSQNEEIALARVWGGNPKEVALAVDQDIYLTVPRGSFNSLSAFINYNQELKAPIEENLEVGEVEILLDEDSLVTFPLRTMFQVAEAGLWERIKDQFYLWTN
ncbi:MAG: D-alanyl-D-alanine carboxypeptidase family protein [Pseudomonadota bacterium]|nr:serine-type D-Ala-D-Ala carboxypeptidase [Gammaproteobacteria bacterium]MEE2684048.1 D-alanyl-D-alanine carboxypeptidase family protein [Pseudomonadota bacterium]